MSLFKNVKHAFSQTSTKNECKIKMEVTKNCRDKMVIKCTHDLIIEYYLDERLKLCFFSKTDFDRNAEKLKGTGIW
jgi:hypothetical protein